MPCITDGMCHRPGFWISLAKSVELRVRVVACSFLLYSVGAFQSPSWSSHTHHDNLEELEKGSGPHTQQLD